MITTSLGEYYFIGNDIPVLLTSDKAVATPGTFANQAITFTQIPLDGETLTLSWDNGNQSITLLFSDAPGESDNEISTTGDSLVDWLSGSFIPALRQNHTISVIFLTEVLDGDSAAFIARKNGEAYNLVVTNTVTGGVTYTNFELGIDEILNDNLKILLNVDYKKLTSSDWKTKQYLIGTDNGQALVFLNKILNSEFAQNTFPAFLPSAVQSFRDALLNVRLRYSEQFGSGDSYIRNKLQTKDVNTKILPGGVDYSSFTRLDMEAAFTADKTWLTNYPETNKITPTQPFFLNFYNHAAVALLDLNLKIYYTDGSSSANIVKHNQSAAVQGVYLTPMHYDYIKADADPDKTVSRWEMWWSSDNNPATLHSSKITLELEYKNVQDEVLLIYKNSYGVYEVERFTGVISQQTEIESRQISTYKLNPTAADPASKNYGSRYTLLKEIYTGFRTKERMLQLMDFLRSEDVYIVKPTYYHPVFMEAADGELFNTKSGKRNGLKIKLFDTARNKYYSDGRYSV